MNDVLPFTISNVQDTGVGLNANVNNSGAWGPEFRYSLDGGSTFTQWMGRHALHCPAGQCDGAAFGEYGLDLLVLGAVPMQPHLQPDEAAIRRCGRDHA